ncbi:hypothetical protein [Roseateles sp.]|uniref:hypothetical protein n=1 Tax=Roseateles sp. TaxID=1971397 RepID=UPI003BA65875
MCTDPAPKTSEAADYLATTKFGPPRFALGQIVATRAVASFFNLHGINAMEYLRLHARCRYGEVSIGDASANDEAVRNGGRVLSAYPISGRVVWVITEADRSSTCLLFPSEY